MSFKDNVKVERVGECAAGSCEPVWLNESQFVVVVPTKAKSTKDLNVTFGAELGDYVIRVSEIVERKRPEQEQRVIDILANSRFNMLAKVDTPKDHTQIAEIRISRPKWVVMDAKGDFVDGNVVVLVQCAEHAEAKEAEAKDTDETQRSRNRSVVTAKKEKVPAKSDLLNEDFKTETKYYVNGKEASKEEYDKASKAMGVDFDWGDDWANGFDSLFGRNRDPNHFRRWVNDFWHR
jgi:hypothetical protein